jgi:hypothetical protein
MNGLKSRVPFTMSDMQGRTVASGKTDESGRAEFGNLVSGQYLVRISNEEGKTKTGILIVKN